MPDQTAHPTLGIVTPTFRRPKLLRRFLKRLLRQTYPHWRAVIVHDGPSAEIAALVAAYAQRDSRISFMQTDAPANDVGVSPRHAGAAYFTNLADPPDYCLFWDDDNYFATDALQKIAAALVASGHPDLLLVRMEYRSRLLPPADVPARALSPGQIDTANMVVRLPLALAAYANVLEQKARSPHQSLYTQDYIAFDHLRSLKNPPARIHIARDIVIGFHDGLRWRPYLRHLLRIPPLDLFRRRSTR
jgi:glycosyltransferase involved in cell wall biosynthesis